MSSISIEVDVDIDEALEAATTKELCRELISRLRTTKQRKQVTEDDKKELAKELEAILQEFKLFPPKPKKFHFPSELLDDQLKLEHLQEIWEKYSSEDFIKALPL